MKFWDSSAIVPLLVKESTSARLISILDRDREMIVWWSSEPEIVSALARLERDSALPPTTLREILDRLDVLSGSWIEVEPSVVIRETARRLLRTHPLRAGDALQLAAAIQAAEGHPSTLSFVCLDERLSEAAEREGFVIINDQDLEI